MDLRIQESLSNGDITFIQDLNDDGKADRIRSQGSKVKSYALDSLLIREYDFEDHQREFEEADQEIAKCFHKRDK